MITAEIVQGSTTYSLTDGKPFELVEIDGIADTTSRVLSERGPLQDGDTDLGYRLEPRVIRLKLQAKLYTVVTGGPGPDYEPGDKVAPFVYTAYGYSENRALINKLFKPSTIPLELRIGFDGAVAYVIGVRSLGGFELPSSITSELMQTTVVSLRAADPLWSAPVVSSLYYNVAGGGTGYLIPNTVPFTVGRSRLEQAQIITYLGTHRTYPTITIIGPLNLPVITNQTTGKVITFTSNIAAGDTYTIDLRYGRKFVYRNGNTADNRTNEVSTTSDLATFAIEADPEVAGGQNSIQVIGDGTTTATQVYLQYVAKYAGI